MEEGLDRFDSALSKKMHEFNVSVAHSDELDDLQRTIDKTNRKLMMKFKREHKYEVAKHEEQLYKEVVYDTRIDASEAEEQRFMNPLKKARRGSGSIRNLDEAQKEAMQIVSAPLHARKKTPFQHMHPEFNKQDGKTVKMYDPYAYFRSNLSAEEEKNFLAKE